MFRHKKLGLFVVSLFLILVGAACTMNLTQQDSTSDEDLIGSEWILRLLDGESLIPNTNVTLEFDMENIGGFAGCNAYSGPYVSGKKNALQVEEIAQQAEGCIEPEGVLEQEEAYIQALMSVRAYRLEEGKLQLLDEAEDAVLVYDRRVAAAMDPAILEGISWVLQTLGSQVLISGTRITIHFSQGGMTGDAGCREYEGLYQAEEDHIVFPMLSMLGEICGDEDLLMQEMVFTEYLSQSTHYRVDGDRLELFTATGEVFVFVKE